MRRTLNFFTATISPVSLLRHFNTTPYAPSPTTPTTSYLFIFFQCILSPLPLPLPFLCLPFPRSPPRVKWKSPLRFTAPAHAHAHHSLCTTTLFRLPRSPSLCCCCRAVFAVLYFLSFFRRRPSPTRAGMKEKRVFRALSYHFRLLSLTRAMRRQKKGGKK